MGQCMIVSDVSRVGAKGVESVGVYKCWENMMTIDYHENIGEIGWRGRIKWREVYKLAGSTIQKNDYVRCFNLCK